MKPSHLIIFSVLFVTTIIISSAALVTSGIALNQSNRALDTASSAPRDADAAMALLAGKTALAAVRLGSKISIPTYISKLWH